MPTASANHVREKSRGESGSRRPIDQRAKVVARLPRDRHLHVVERYSLQFGTDEEGERQDTAGGESAERCQGGARLRPLPAIAAAASGRTRAQRHVITASNPIATTKNAADALVKKASSAARPHNSAQRAGAAGHGEPATTMKAAIGPSMSAARSHIRTRSRCRSRAAAGRPAPAEPRQAERERDDREHPGRSDTSRACRTPTPNASNEAYSSAGEDRRDVHRVPVVQRPGAEQRPVAARCGPTGPRRARRRRRSGARADRRRERSRAGAPRGRQTAKRRARERRAAARGRRANHGAPARSTCRSLQALPPARSRRAATRPSGGSS